MSEAEALHDSIDNLNLSDIPQITTHLEAHQTRAAIRGDYRVVGFYQSLLPMLNGRAELLRELRATKGEMK